MHYHPPPLFPPPPFQNRPLLSPRPNPPLPVIRAICQIRLCRESDSASSFCNNILFSSCTFHSVGTAAGEQKFNSLCVLSLNIINEKIYLFLWFWFYSLTLITGCHLVFRIFVLIMPCSRSFLLLLRARLFRPSDLRTVRRILSRCYLGDWWVLYQIGRNSNTHFFR